MSTTAAPATATTSLSTSISTSTTTSPANCGANTYVIPTKDSACALPSKSNYSEILHHCCKDADIEDYDDGCGIYCLAQGQSVGDLQKCLTSNGAADGEVFCNAAMNATATASASKTASETGTSSTSTGSATQSGSDAAKTDNAAVALVRPGISKSGLGLLAMVFCSVVLGGFA